MHKNKTIYVKTILRITQMNIYEIGLSAFHLLTVSLCLRPNVHTIHPKFCVIVVIFNTI